MTVPPTHGLHNRCTAADLRLQWSSAYSGRLYDPEALVRLRHRVDATLDVLARELSAATIPAMYEALATEMAEVRDVAAGLSRMEARDAALKNKGNG